MFSFLKYTNCLNLFYITVFFVIIVCILDLATLYVLGELLSEIFNIPSSKIIIPGGYEVPQYLLPAIFVLQFISRIILEHLQKVLSVNFQKKLVAFILDKILSKNINEIENIGVSSIRETLLTETFRFNLTILNLLQVINNICLTLLIFLVGYWIAGANFFILTLLLILPLTITVFFLTKFANRAGQIRALLSQRTSKNVISFFQNVRQSRAERLETSFENDVVQIIEEDYKNYNNVGFFTRGTKHSTEFIFLMFIFGTYYFFTEPVLTDFIALIFLIRITPAFLGIASSFVSLRLNYNSASNLLDMAWEKKNCTKITHSRVSETEQRLDFEILDIEVDDLGVSNNYQFLFPLRFEHGQKIRVKGPSGAGKTTFVDAILGFRTDLKFSMMLNGRKSAGLAEEMLVSYLSQNSYFKQQTVTEFFDLDNVNPSYENDLRENYSLLRLDEELGMAFDQFKLIEIEENGSNFSGGQKQRIRLLKVLLSNNPVIVFDEATSALDASIESICLELLANKKCALQFYITHSDDWVLNFDQELAIKS
jgi:ABC-type bacteriocin/lantibiotic exporter with double-glycine peptidase domain